MEHVYLIFLLLQLSASPIHSCYGQESDSAIAGRAALAILHPNFPCQAYRAASKKISPYAISFLWNTFGSSFGCLDQELKNPNLKLVQAHLINGPCLRNKRCGSYEVFYGYTQRSLALAVSKKDPELQKKIQASAMRLAEYLLPRLQENVSCYINPVLESDLSRENSLIIQNWIAPYFSERCQFVWNPLGSNPGKPISGASVSEGHGSRPEFTDRHCFASNDGEVIRGKQNWINFFLHNKDCIAVFAWTLNDNCLSASEPWKDPRTRECSDISDFTELKAAISAINRK